VSESAARIATRRHSAFDDTWTRNFEPKEDDEEEDEPADDDDDQEPDFGVARSVPEEDLEGIFQFSAENSRSNSESATVATTPQTLFPGRDEPDDTEDDDDEMSVYGDARSRQTSFVRLSVVDC